MFSIVTWLKMRPAKKDLKSTPASGSSSSKKESKATPASYSSSKIELKTAATASGSSCTSWNFEAVQRLVQDVTTWQATLKTVRMPNQKVQASDDEKKLA